MHQSWIAGINGEPPDSYPEKIKVRTSQKTGESYKSTADISGGRKHWSLGFGGQYAAVGRSEVSAYSADLNTLKRSLTDPSQP